MIVDATTITVIVLAILVGSLAVWVAVLERRLKRLAAGKRGSSLEDTIYTLTEDVQNIKAGLVKAGARFETIDNRLRKGINHIKTVRFNPFPDQGGNQSFATAFLNDEGDGVVISSLYARDKICVYGKPLCQHRSEYELTAEEEETLAV